MTPRTPRWRHLAMALVAAVLVLAGVPALSAPGDSYVRAHFGDQRLPAGCVLDLDPANPDNECYHLKVGLNALDTPRVDVAVLVPVSPFAERDLRVVQQSIDMWEGGLDMLAGQMGMEWLRDGTDFRVRGYGVPVDPEGGPAEVLNLVDPEIVVVASNPAGGIGIGIDPSDFASQIGITDGEGVPCQEVEVPSQVFSLDAWRTWRATTATTARPAASTSRTAAAWAATSASPSTARSTPCPARPTSSASSTSSRTRWATA